jgi:hypothetical protein
VQGDFIVNIRIAVIPLLVLVAACSAEAPAESAAADPIAAGLDTAASAGKNVLVLYTKEGCNCSAIMDKTLEDPEVKEALAKTVFVRVTKDKDASGFESRWADAEAPCFAVLGADGEAMGGLLKGPFEAGEFLFFLDWVADPMGPRPELIRIEDGCTGCGAEDEQPAKPAANEGGCGGCSEKPASTEKSGCGGCTEQPSVLGGSGCGGCTGE